MIRRFLFHGEIGFLRRLRVSASPIFSIFMAAVICTPGILQPSAIVSVETPSATVISLPPEGTYEDGQVIVTLATPRKTPLTKEGTTSFDEHITVDDSWNFGDAQVLGSNETEKDFLADKSLYVTKVSSDTYSTAELLSELDNQAYVVSVEPDYYQEKRAVTNDPMSGLQWYLDGAGVPSEGIHYSNVAQNSSGKAPIVAVVDTGVDYTHEDLAPHMWKNPYSSLEGTYGYDFGDGDSDPSDQDEDGHGTHCAGVISAVTNNGKGISGVCSNAKIMALKIFRYQGQASNSAVIGAFNYIYEAQQLGANIVAVNCSWGGGESSSIIKSLIQKIGKAGAVFVFAAGNEGKNHDTLSSKECPYDINSPYIVKVGASDTSDNRAVYSDYGASSVNLFAPGSQILSTINNPIFYPALLPSAQRNSLCSYFSTGDETDTSMYRTTGDITVSDIRRSQEDAFGSTQSGSFCIDVFPTIRGSSLSFYLDVTDLNLSPMATYQVACDIGINEGSGVEWEHDSHERSSSSLVTSNGRTYMLILGLNGSLRSVSQIYLDNVCISKANPSSSSFVKYNVYSGTSMAAPSVSAAVAILSSVYTTDNAVQRCERLLSCVRKVGALSGFCTTGGVLDLSKVKSAVYKTPSDPGGKIKVNKIQLNKKKAVLRYKKKLKLKATVKPTNASNKKVTWSVSNKKYASVTKKGVVKAKKKGIGHTVKVYAKAKDGSGKKAFCKVKIKKK